MQRGTAVGRSRVYRIKGTLTNLLRLLSRRRGGIPPISSRKYYGGDLIGLLCSSACFLKCNAIGCAMASKEARDRISQQFARFYEPLSTDAIMNNSITHYQTSELLTRNTHGSDEIASGLLGLEMTQWWDIFFS